MKWVVASSVLIGSCLMAGNPPARVPVLLELFTSEGCSSCPPADLLLRKFDRDQSIAGADLVVLSEHVDYWNQLGWADPFSAPLYSQRQREYAERLSGEVYTPELVVDGAKGLVGSDAREAVAAVRDTLRTPKAAIGVAAQLADGKAKIGIHLDGAVDGDLYLALAHDAMSSQVLRGENRGRALSHVAVVYSFRKIAKIDRGAAFDRNVTVEVQGVKTRIVAFVAKAGSGRVVAIGQARL
jgi:hypothetical protein